MSILTAGTVTVTAPASVDGVGEVAVLNDSASGNYVGDLWGVSGFAGASVRTSKDSIVEGHGAVFGSFYHGERTFTLDVLLQRSATYALSDVRYNKLCRATNAMAADGTIVWTDSDGIAKRLLFRREQPPSDPDETRHILIAASAADPRIYANTATTDGGTSPQTLTNVGNVSTPPTFTLTAPTNTIVLTGGSRTLTLTGLSGAGTVTVDFGARTVTATNAPTNRYSAVATFDWWELPPGNCDVAWSGATVSATGISFRSAWLSG